MSDRYSQDDIVSIGDFIVKYHLFSGWQIIAYTGRDTAVTIPPELDGEPITRIGEFAFSPKNPLVSEEQKEFLRHSLKSVDFDVMLMQKFPLEWSPLAFAGCEALKTPVPAESIDDYWIKSYPTHLYPDCPNIYPVATQEGDKGVLKKVSYGDALPGYVIVSSAYHTVGHCAAMKNTASCVYLAEGVEIIDAAAFANMPYLSDVYLPSSIKKIAPNAFAHCPLLSKESKQAISAYVTPNPLIAKIKYSRVITDDSGRKKTITKNYRLTVNDVDESDDFIILNITEASARVYLTRTNETVILPLGEKVVKSHDEHDNGSIIEGGRYYERDENIEYTFTLTKVK